MNGFSDLELKYRKIQINGTVYVITRLQLSSEQLVALEAGAGEVELLTNLCTSVYSKGTICVFSCFSHTFKSLTLPRTL